MDLFSFLATIILITSVVTLVVAIAAYTAYKIREVRKPSKNKRSAQSVADKPIFLRPVNHATVQELKQALHKSRSTQHHAQNTQAEQMGQPGTSGRSPGKQPDNR